MLRIDHVTHYFGGLRAVEDFCIDIAPQQIIGLIGPNGAGKTTIFNLITGVYKPTQGKISFEDEDITGKLPYKITQHGIVRTFQNIRLFSTMTVLENIMVAHHYRMKSGLLSSLMRLPSFTHEEEDTEALATKFAKIFKLDDVLNVPAGSLPYGRQRRVEIARALVTEPKMLLLDEPAAGMNPKEALELLDLIKQIAIDFKLTILLIEHQMPVVMGVAERIHVLDFGKTLAVGTPKEIQNHPKVIEAYLGEGAKI
ncbi:MAG: ABC transporter ATP-binding protein [Spirochaetes bacterium]|nr:ABC transporter ATP-binding protein [Spirochaetota bacterium]MBU0954944.1 ABC transporter ATP-binding protein [Spirochaetota bacterium]